MQAKPLKHTQKRNSSPTNTHIEKLHTSACISLYTTTVHNTPGSSWIKRAIKWIVVVVRTQTSIRAQMLYVGGLAATSHITEQ